MTIVTQRTLMCYSHHKITSWLQQLPGSASTTLLCLPLRASPASPCVPPLQPTQYLIQASGAEPHDQSGIISGGHSAACLMPEEL